MWPRGPHIIFRMKNVTEKTVNCILRDLSKHEFIEVRVYMKLRSGAREIM